MQDESMMSEVERDIQAAFESVRARQSVALIAAEAGREAGDWETSKANRDAFLLVEDRRRRLAARSHGPDRLRRGRYRDLLLITNLISIEYELLTDRGDRSVRVSSQEKPQLSGLQLPADWAQPWGVTAMFELRAAFGNYCQRRDRLARRLSSRARERAAAEAGQELDRICDSTGLNRGPDEGRTKPAPIDSGPGMQRRQRASRKTMRSRSPRRGRLLIGAAAIAAFALAIAGAYVALGGEGASSSAPADRAGLPERPLPMLGYGSESKPARDRERAEPEPAPEPEREPRTAGADRPAPPEPETMATSFSAPAATPAPVRDAAPPSPPKPKPKPPKSSSPPKPKPPKSKPPKSEPAPAPAPLPAPAPAAIPDSPPTG